MADECPTCTADEDGMPALTAHTSRLSWETGSDFGPVRGIQPSTPDRVGQDLVRGLDLIEKAKQQKETENE